MDVVCLQRLRPPGSSPRAVHGCYVTGSRAGARATRVNARRPAAGSPSARHARDLTCGSPFTHGVRAEAPPPDRPRTRTTTTPRAAPVATPAQARLSPRARIERGARRHVRLRACCICMVSGWPARPRMHHAPCEGRGPIARSLLVSARRLLRAQLSSLVHGLVGSRAHANTNL